MVGPKQTRVYVEINWTSESCNVNMARWLEIDGTYASQRPMWYE